MKERIVKDDTIVSDSEDEVHERGRVNSMKEHIKEFPISLGTMASWRKFSHFSKHRPNELSQRNHPQIMQ